MKNMKKIKLIALLAALALIGVDRLTKWLAVRYLKPLGSVGIISAGDTQVLNLTYAENTGAAFSILRGQTLFLIITTSLMIAAVLVFLIICKTESRLFIWSLALIIAGGTGNLIDRIAYHYVVDFIDFRIINFAVFNFADMCAVCGAFLLLFAILREDISKMKRKKNAPIETDKSA